MSPQPVDFDHHSQKYADGWRDVTAELRSSCPVAWTEAHGGFWVVTGYDEVTAIAHDAERFQNGRVDGVSSVLIPSTPVPLVPTEVDPPLHTQIRRTLNPIFTTRMAAAWKPFVTETTDALIDGFAERGEADLVRELAKPVTSNVNLALVGLPAENSETYIDAAGLMVRERPGSPLYEGARQAVRDMEQTIHDVLAERRRSPRDDVATVISHIEIDGEPAPFELLHNLLETLVSGGGSTTVSLIAHALLWAPDSQADRRELAGDPERVAAYMRECLRLSTPASNLGRLAREPAEVAGRQIRAGDRIVLCYAAANRDESAFADPDALLPDRSNDKHLSFGIGRHRCIGMHMATMTAQTVVERVFERLPDYVVRDIERYPRIPIVNGVVGLPASFTPGRPVGATIPVDGPPLPERVQT